MPPGMPMLRLLLAVSGLCVLAEQTENADYPG
jgi:hypothetical protein